MEAIIGSGRRITIPKEVFAEMYSAKEGMKVDVTFEDGRFILTPIVVTERPIEHKSEYVSNEDQTKLQLNKIHTEKETKPKQKTSNFKRQIKSNLSEANKYSKKIFSECGLVIRTKRRYINEFCEDCKGELLGQSYEGDHKCPYKDTNFRQVTETLVDTISEQDKILKDKKDVLKNIQKNIEQLQNNIDEEIEESKETVQAMRFYRKDSTTLFPVQLRDFRKCEMCGELVKIGFIIDNEEFYCKSCAAKDFANYLKERKVK